MTRKEMTSIMKFWVKQLDLKQWDINIRYATAEELLDKDNPVSRNDATCAFSTEYAKATIIIRPLKYRDCDPEEVNIEEDIIHELLHLVLEGHVAQCAEDPMFERGINIVTSALYRMKYDAG